MVQAGIYDFPHTYMRRVRIWMRSILLNHAQRYPQWTIEDLYKLIHQAAMGNVHIKAEEKVIRAKLEQEIAGLVSGPPEPLVDPISADNRVVRVHLRSFADLDFDREILVKAIIMTTRHFAGSLNNLSEYARIALQLCQENVLAFAPDNFARYIADRRESNFPPVHHSPIYNEMYHPAYRIVVKETLPKEMLK